jgi:hypothetical protein
MIKKRIIPTEYQMWKINKELLKARAKRLKTTPDKLKAEEAKKLKIMKEIAQEIANFKTKSKTKI